LTARISIGISLKAWRSATTCRAPQTGYGELDDVVRLISMATGAMSRRCTGRFGTFCPRVPESPRRRRCCTDRLPLVDQLRDALLEQIKAQDVDGPAFGTDRSLWDYLHRRDLELGSATNHLLTPLFGLDQFEELFTHGEQIPGAVTELRSDFGNLAENGMAKSHAGRRSARICR